MIIPEGTTKIEVDERGTMTFFSGETPLMTDQLGIYKFQNKSGLMSAGGGKFRATEASERLSPQPMPLLNRDIWRIQMLILPKK